MVDRVKKFFHYLYLSIKRPEMEILPGNLAFFFMMMIIPLLTILGAFVSNIDIGERTVYETLQSSFPENIANLIISVAGEGSSSISFIVLIVGSLLLASNGTYSMIVTSNSIYGIRNNHYIKNRIKAFVLMIVLVLLFIFLLIIPVINNKMISIIGKLLNVNIADNIYVILYKTLKYPIIFLLVYVFVKILYKFSPNRKANKRTSYGAIFTSLSLMIVTWGYSIYIDYFSTYETFYGGVSSLLFLMLWIYIISYIFVLGMNLNFAREKVKEEIEKSEETS